MKNRRRYAIVFGVGLAAALLAAAAEGVFSKNEALQIMKALSNAFLVPAVILGGAGLLTVCAAGGSFDLLAYSSMKLLGLFRPGRNKSLWSRDYYEYKTANDKKRRPRWFLVVSGAVFLLLSFVFLALYYAVA
jgi:hypothetical protein